jgi:threonine dehydrogenase-like Zn-dependent dehydrogenase
MRQLVFVKPGTVEWQETPAPHLETPQDALVRPIASATFTVRLLRGLAPFAGPFPLGHEFVGEIVDLGAGVAGFEAGDRVVVAFQIGCGECSRCHRGLTASCRAVPAGSMYGLRPVGGDWGGALADLVHVPFAERMMMRVPPGTTPAAVASASDNIADAWRAVAPHLDESPGADVLVVGSPSSIALYTVMIARACGAGRIDYLDTDRVALTLAESLGANAIEGLPPNRAGSYPITIDASGDPDGLACAPRSVTPEGACTSVNIYFEPPRLPLLEMYTRGVRFFTDRVNSRATLPRVLELVGSGRLPTDVVTSEVVPWGDAPTALASPSMKLVIAREPCRPARASEAQV